MRGAPTLLVLVFAAAGCVKDAAGVLDRSAAPRLLRPGSPTGSSTIDLEGTAEPGSSVEVFVNGFSRQTTTTSRTGAFHFRDVPLEPGRNRIRVRSMAAFVLGPPDSRRSVDSEEVVVVRKRS